MVRSAKGPAKFYDGQGRYFRVDPNGAKRWVQQLVIRGKTRELGLGSAQLVTLAEAREVTLTYRKLARAGGDPLEDRREAAAVLTFEEQRGRCTRHTGPSWRNEKQRGAVHLDARDLRLFRASAGEDSDVLGGRSRRSGFRSRRPRGGCGSGSARS